MSHPAKRHLELKPRAMTTKALLLTVFCCVSGGPYGLEPVIKAGGAGLGLLLIVLTPIVWALPDALTTAELAAAIPEEGGYVVWVRRAMGPFWGFLNAWWTWLYSLVDAAIYPVMFTGYLGQILKTYGVTNALDRDPNLQWRVAAIVIVCFTFLNIRGTKLVGRASSLFAFVIILPFLLLAAIGIYRWIGNPHPIVTSFVPPGTTPTAALSAGLGTVMWNYLGWDALSTIAEEVDQPERAYPRAILYGVPLVTLVYLLPTLAGLAFFPDASHWEEGAWPTIARAVGGEWLGGLVGLVALVSPLALFTASLLGSSRVPYVLAEERFLPRPLVAIHPKFGTPWKAIALCGVIYAILAYQTFHELVQLNVVMYSAALILECASLLILRRKEPDLPRPFRVRGGWLGLALVFVLPVAMLGLLVGSAIQEEGWGKQGFTLGALLSGPILYVAIKAIQRKTRDR